MAVAAAAFTIMHSLIKQLGEGLHGFEIAFFRVLFGLVILSPVLMRQGMKPLMTSKLRLFGMRGIANAAAMLMFFHALTITPLATAEALGFTAPIFATLLAIPILGEVVRARRLTAVVIGFIGALVILRPGLIEIDLGPMLVIASSIAWALAMMVIKLLTRTEANITIVLYGALFLAPVTFVAALPVWIWPTPEQLFWLFLLGLIGTGGQMAMNQAFKLADASAVLPLDFTKLIWAAALGYLLFGEVPDLWTWVGGALIFGSATYIGMREARLKSRGGK